MHILLVGGGSGGHVTPLSAVATELLNKDDRHEITVVTDRSFLMETIRIFKELPRVKIRSIFAGKYRRYHGKSAFWHLTHLPTLLYNIRDVVYILIGIVQSVYILIRHNPDVVFCKGGFVCIPVGIVARIMRKRLVIHDSDTRPGITNRLLSRWASVIATGMPVSFYPYDLKKMHYIGMPVSKMYKPITENRQNELKQELGFAKNQPLLLVTGGGNGAQSLNELFSGSVGELLKSGWGIVHLAGRGKSIDLKKKRDSLPNNIQNNWQIEEFADMVPRLMAADVILARTSASTLQEAANAQKVVIGIPSPYLEDQKMNANYFSDENALTALNELSLTSGDLVNVITKMYKNTKQSVVQAQTLHSKFAKPHSATELARLIVS